MGAKSQPISPPFGHKAGLPPSKKYLLVRQPLFCAKNQLDLKTTLVVIVVTDEQVKKITNTFKPLKSERGKGHE